jgi:aspartate racemase
LGSHIPVLPDDQRIHSQKQLGEQHTARILLHSVDFREIDLNRRRGDWAEVGRILGEAGSSLRAGGADFIVIASNTMHQIADRIHIESGLDLLHIGDPTGSEIQKDGYRKVALLGTRFTMESDFYPKLLSERYGLSVMAPDAEERTEVNRIMTDELRHGVVRTESRTFIGDLIRSLHQRGAEAVILACSEITMIVPPDTDMIPVYDTTRLHVRAAVKHALGELSS